MSIRQSQQTIRNRGFGHGIEFMQIEFVYFDLGNILVSFDPEIACANAAEVTGLSIDVMRGVLYGQNEQGDTLLHLYENGSLTGHQFFRLIAEISSIDNEDVSKHDFLDAISDMFTPINSMVEVVKFARSKVKRVGVLSNTCPAHWNWVRRQPWPVSMIDFDVTILSYEVRSMKPDARIYEAAEQAAAVAPHRILFIDDREENVLAARERGWNAEQCLGGEQAAEVIRRHLSKNKT